MIYGAGEFRDIVDIKTKSYTADGLGGFTSTETTKIHCHAIVKVKKSKDGVVAGRDLEIRTHEVVIRLSQAYEPKKEDVVVWRNKALRVLTVIPDYTEMVCVLECINED